VRTRDRVGLYCFLASSIFVCEESWRLGLGDFHSPGPGFFPLGISAGRPTEAGALGAFGALVLCVVAGRMK
jgi:hypothetical protein